MKKQKILKKLEDAGVIALVRGSFKEEAIQASQALVRGGVVGLEVTFTVPNADQAIATLGAYYQGDANLFSENEVYAFQTVTSGEIKR